MNIPEKNICAVYCIENINNGRKYVGASESLRDRIKAHLRLLRQGKHTSELMQKDFSRGDQFTVHVLREFPKHSRADMLDFEHHETIRLDSVANGYNKQMPAADHHVHKPREYKFNMEKIEELLQPYAGDITILKNRSMIKRLCGLLNCQPEDITEYTQD